MPLCLAFGALLHAMTPKQVGFHAVMRSILGSVNPIVCPPSSAQSPRSREDFLASVHLNADSFRQPSIW